MPLISLYLSSLPRLVKSRKDWLRLLRSTSSFSKNWNQVSEYLWLCLVVLFDSHNGSNYSICFLQFSNYRITVQYREQNPCRWQGWTVLYNYIIQSIHYCTFTLASFLYTKHWVVPLAMRSFHRFPPGVLAKCIPISVSENQNLTYKCPGK